MLTPSHTPPLHRRCQPKHRVIARRLAEALEKAKARKAEEA